MDTRSLTLIEQIVVVEVRDQLKNLPPSFRKYRSEIDSREVITDAIGRLPRSFQTLGENSHDRQMQQLRVKIAVRQSIASVLQELKFYYIVQADLEDDDDIPTEPISECQR